MSFGDRCGIATGRCRALADKSWGLAGSGWDVSSACGMIRIGENFTVSFRL